jgi:hypothetical protein
MDAAFLSDGDAWVGAFRDALATHGGGSGSEGGGGGSSSGGQQSSGGSGSGGGGGGGRQRVRLAVLDHIISFPPVVVPVERLCGLLRCALRQGGMAIKRRRSQGGSRGPPASLPAARRAQPSHLAASLPHRPRRSRCSRPRLGPYPAQTQRRRHPRAGGRRARAGRAAGPGRALAGVRLLRFKRPQVAVSLGGGERVSVLVPAPAAAVVPAAGPAPDALPSANPSSSSLGARRAAARPRAAPSCGRRGTARRAWCPPSPPTARGWASGRSFFGRARRTPRRGSRRRRAWRRSSGSAAWGRSRRTTTTWWGFGGGGGGGF